MSPPALTEDEIQEEIFSNHREVYDKFLEHFPSEIEQLIAHIHAALSRIVAFSQRVDRDIRAAWTEWFLLSALNNLVTSSKLLVSGLLQPSGNQMRGYGESYAMTLLVSHRQTGVLEQLERNDRFPVHKAIQTVKRRKNRKHFKIDPEGWERFERVTDWYDAYSHASLFALASQARFDEPGAIMLGSGFDDNKIDVYRKELATRISAAERLIDLAVLVQAAVQESQRAREST